MSTPRKEESDRDESAKTVNLARVHLEAHKFKMDNFEELLAAATNLRRQLPPEELTRFMHKPASSIRKWLRTENGHIKWRQQLKLHEDVCGDSEED